MIFWIEFRQKWIVYWIDIFNLWLKTLFFFFWAHFGHCSTTFLVWPVLIIPWHLNWIIDFIESPPMFLSWINVWIEFNQPLLNQILNWINVCRNSNFELIRFGYCRGLQQTNWTTLVESKRLNKMWNFQLVFVWQRARNNRATITYSCKYHNGVVHSSAFDNFELTLDTQFQDFKDVLASIFKKKDKIRIKNPFKLKSCE